MNPRKIMVLAMAAVLGWALVTAAAEKPANADATSLAFSDPANVSPPPAWAVSQVNRSPDFDALGGFQKPPAGFGIVPFYWWLGDPLTKERLSWELDQLTDMGICGLQINYAHSDRGGHSYGLTIPSDPPLFSDEWWKLVGWLMQQAKPRGIALSLSDYTLGFGQGWCVDEMLREHPDLAGSQLKLVKGAAADALAAADVHQADGKTQRVSVCVDRVAWSLDPMNANTGPEYAKKFVGRFEDHFPGEGGKGLNFFFSDELQFGVRGWLWTARFAEEFKKRKGYDIVPELPALFVDIGPRTPKIRLDYSDVMVALTEAGYFKPLFEWHQSRGMTMGCDHGGRGRNVVEFGDYFRAQRWNQGPGCDQPHLGKDLIKAKVASSMAHLYLRPRVWLEGFYGSGWGTTSSGVVDATFADFVMGHNLMSFHGLYYSTHGGWWEWAPPCNGFHMPYWKHMRTYSDCVQRLAFLLSQGHHRCDVAILYPVAPTEAGMGGPESVKAAFDTAREIYAKSIDFDFMDFESLDRAQIVGKELHVSGEIYKMLVLPGMKAIRHSTLQKALEFKRAGGIVLAVGALPEASDRVGRDDPEVAAMVKELFPHGAVLDVASRLPSRDYDGPGYIMHRRIGPRDVYAIYNAPQGTACKFRATGKVELWDPWTGQTRPLPVTSQREGITELPLPLTQTEMQLIVFSPGQPEIANAAPAPQINEIQVSGDWEFELQPMLDNRFGDYHWPPTPTLIGAEVRQLEYTESDRDKGPWRRVTNSFGPQFMKIGPVRPFASEASLKPDAKWTPYEFSWRWSVENDPGHQGYHGLKAEVHDEFIALGKPKRSMTNTAYEKEGAGGSYYLWTTVAAPRAMTAYALAGALKPAKVWLNNQPVSGAELKLSAGANALLLRYDQVGRTYFVVSTGADDPAATPLPPVNEQPKFKLSPLAMHWWKNAAILPFDVQPEQSNPVGWYRFTSPPGLRAMIVPACGKVQAWANGKEMTLRDGKFEVAEASASSVPVLLRIEQARGCYGGAALSDPIRLECAPGTIALGDWSKIDGLLCYSGGAWYRKTVNIPAGKQIVLDLGDVAATAEVRVNGRPAGVRVSPPWRVDITSLAKPGENRIEVLICNTLANHYTTIPTNYRGATTSGLIGPVNIRVQP